MKHIALLFLSDLKIGSLKLCKWTLQNAIVMLIDLPKMRKWTSLLPNRCANGLTNIAKKTEERNVYAIETWQTERRKTFGNNTYKQYGFRAFSDGLRIFIKSQNLWDFALARKKRKNKTKRFC